MITLANVHQVQANFPPRVCIYGPQGSGKTSLAAEFPNPVFIQTEEGTPSGHVLNSFGHITTPDDLYGAVSALSREEHNFSTLVLDAADSVDLLIQRKVCMEKGWASIETPDFGKGYVAAEEKWVQFMLGLDILRKHRGMNIVIIAHSDIHKLEMPGRPPFNSYTLRMHRRAASVVKDQMDAVFFIDFAAEVKETDMGFNKKSVHVEGGGTRFINTEQRPAFFAKNRYGLPARMPFWQGRMMPEFAKKMPIYGYQQPQNA